MAECQIISGSKFQVTFTQANSSRKLTGQTSGLPFLTPYSTRKIKSVTFSYYNGCKMANDEGLAVQGTDSISTFQQQLIPSSDIVFSSDSKVLADLHANLKL